MNGAWSDWSAWTSCSTTCGDGQRTKSRTCDNPPPAHDGEDCDGDAEEPISCLIRECPGNLYYFSLVFLNIKKFIYYFFSLQLMVAGALGDYGDLVPQRVVEGSESALGTVQILLQHLVVIRVKT